MAIALGVLVGIVVVWLPVLTVMVASDWLAWNRVYKYASAQAERHLAEDVIDPMGRAYSDMATVIVLRGKVEQRAEAS